MAKTKLLAPRKKEDPKPAPKPMQPTRQNGTQPQPTVGLRIEVEHHESD